MRRRGEDKERTSTKDWNKNEEVKKQMRTRIAGGGGREGEAGGDRTESRRIR